MIPQLIYIGLTVFGLGWLISKENKEEKYSFGGAIFAHFCLNFLYYCGEFYNTLGIPQLIIISWSCFNIGVHLAKQGKTFNHKIFLSIIVTIIQVGILYWGGFFDCFKN